MFIISARDRFNNPDSLSESGHQFKEIDLRSDRELRSFGNDENAFCKAMGNKSVLLLIHGYNNEQDEVHDAYSVIEEKVQAHIGEHYDLVIGYSWPGGDKGMDWWASKRRANGVARRFRFLIENISQVAASLDIMSHSLGARVALKSLKQSSKESVIRNYFCMAPAIDNEALEKGEEFSDALSKIAALYIFHSKKDGVLAAAYRIAEFDNALGLYGPEDKQYIQHKTKNIFSINCKKKINCHGDYKRSDAIYKYISQTFIKKPIKFKTL